MAFVHRQVLTDPYISCLFCLYFIPYSKLHISFYCLHMWGHSFDGMV